MASKVIENPKKAHYVKRGVRTDTLLYPYFHSGFFPLVSSAPASLGNYSPTAVEQVRQVTLGIVATRSAAVTKSILYFLDVAFVEGKVMYLVT